MQSDLLFGRLPRDGGAAEPGARRSALLRSASDGVVCMAPCLGDSSRLSRDRAVCRGSRPHPQGPGLMIAAGNGCIYHVEWEPARAVGQCLAAGSRFEVARGASLRAAAGFGIQNRRNVLCLDRPCPAPPSQGIHARPSPTSRSASCQLQLLVFTLALLHLPLHPF
jgi:hypothetical protein